jgi:histidine triad (HIT) family protein
VACCKTRRPPLAGGLKPAAPQDTASRDYHVVMDTCIFCRIIKGVEPAHGIWESDDFLAFLTIHPCNPGHTCLIPKAHVDDVFELQEPLYSRIFQAAKRLSKPLRSATDARRIGIAVEGFSVPHVHLHLVPLYNVSELDPHRHIAQTQEELSVMAAKIRDEIRNVEMDGAT